MSVHLCVRKMNEEDEADVVVDYEGNSSDEEGPIPLSPGDKNDANSLLLLLTIMSISSLLQRVHWMVS